MRNERLDKALDDRRRIYRVYRKAKKLRDQGLYDTPVFGDRLRRFVKTLGHFDMTGSGRMVEYAEREWKTWMREAPADIKFAALQAVDERIMTIREQAGLPPIDDPLPDRPDNAFFTIKKIFGFGIDGGFESA
jgi:hypothetical protein